METPTVIPVGIAELLIAYFCHTTTQAQRDRTHEWICADNGNMRVFDYCLEMSLLPKVIDPERIEELEEFDETNLN